MNLKIETIPVTYAIREVGGDLFGESVLRVSLDDNGDGGFLVIQDIDGNEIKVNPEEWEPLFDAGLKLLEFAK